MPRNYKLYLSDIVKSIDNIEKYTKGVTLDGFLANQMLQDAVLRNLEIIGEAVKNLPNDIKQNDDYFWNKYARMRDLISHFYFGVNFNIIWGLVKSVNSELKAEVNKLL